MNTINTDLTQAAGATIPLGATDAETEALANAEPVKIIGEPSVTVSERAFDSLLDKVMLEYQNTHEKLNLSLLSSAVTSIAAQANIKSQYQKDLLNQSSELMQKLDVDTKKRDEAKANLQAAKDDLQTAEDDLLAAEEALEAAEEALEEAKKADPKQDLSTYEKAVKDAQDARDAAEGKVDGCEKKVKTAQTDLTKAQTALDKTKADLDATLAKLDDSSKSVLVAAARVVMTSDTGYLDAVKEYAKDQLEQKLPALEAFARLLSGENLNDVLMQELGIKA